ncbi:MAG: hypothetical protein KGN84_07090 [Acidobacteriota bacterium]|nr:hypothetical protein [Acidobacteriota bacterium]
MMVERLDDNSKKVLQYLSDGRIASGSQLINATQLDENALMVSIEALVRQGLISYRGALTPDKFFDTFITVRPAARDVSDYLLKY